MKKLISFLLLCSTICFSDLITTFDFDVEESSVFQFNRPNWDESNDTFYYNLAYFTVDTEGSWRAANTSILSHDSFDYSNYQTQFTNNPWFAADTYIYLYENTFDVSDPNKNLIAQNDDGYSGGNSVQKNWLGPWRIGDGVQSNQLIPFLGDIASLSIYNRVLSAEEIK